MDENNLPFDIHSRVNYLQKKINEFEQELSRLKQQFQNYQNDTVKLPNANERGQQILSELKQRLQDNENNQDNQDNNKDNFEIEDNYYFDGDLDVAIPRQASSAMIFHFKENYNFNRFKTVRQAKRMKDFCNAVCCMDHIARHLNGDWKPDWHNENQRKWYIRNEIFTGLSFTEKVGKHVFKSEKLAIRAREMLESKGLLKNYLMDWED